MPLFILHHLRPDQGQIAGIESGEAQNVASSMVTAMLSGKTAAAVSENLYHPVAAIRCAAVDELFRVTNHVDADWTGNAEVAFVDGPQRSTSVGDLAVDLETGLAWSCATIGWERVDDPATTERLLGEAREFAERNGLTQAPH